MGGDTPLPHPGEGKSRNVPDDLAEGVSGLTPGISFPLAPKIFVSPPPATWYKIPLNSV